MGAHAFRLVAVFCGYYLTARLGLSMDAEAGFATLVWPPTGIALAALLLYGYRLWPAIAAAALLVNYQTGASPLVACGIGTGNTLEAVLGAFLLRRFVPLQNSLERVRDVLGLFLFAALLSTLLSATVGVFSLRAGGVISVSDAWPAWRAWWVGDMLGDVLVAPLLLSWCSPRLVRVHPGHVLEAVGLSATLVLAVLASFGGFFPLDARKDPASYLIFPTLIWAALRYGQRGATAASFVTAVLAIWNTWRGHGPFALSTPRESLFYLQLFLGIASATTLLLAAVVCERVRSEGAARESEDRLAALFRQAIAGIAQTDLAGRFVLVNQRFCELVGRPLEQVLRLANADVTHPDDRARELESFRLLAAGGPGFTLEKRCVRPDGAVVWVTSSVSPVRDVNGGVRFMVAVLQDVTARKQAEAALQVAHDESEKRVEERTAELAAANAALRIEVVERRAAEQVAKEAVERTETVNRELESFSYSVSHDLRAPLRAIDGFGELLSEQAGARLDPEGQRMLEIIRSSTRRMGQLIDDLLAFSRWGRQALTPMEVDMDQLVRSAFSGLQPGARAEALDLRIGPLPMAWGDAAVLRQVWTNLLSNALKFSRDKARPVVEVRGEVRDGMNVYSVQDNGAGFDMQYAHKLFGVFQRLHTAEEFEGTGIGLAIVQRVARRHGGDAWAEGKTGDGATLYFSLPAKDSPKALQGLAGGAAGGGGDAAATVPAAVQPEATPRG
ncbi:MAG: MASE1 domain-containing protein [Planctomycetes bacterium]|nr:MASE1 domain-containing protein [Planctomycetota bacterium]